MALLMIHLLASKEGLLVSKQCPSLSLASSPHSRFSNFHKSAVLECVVGERHVAVLLEDGRICRICYSEEIPPLSASVPAPPPPAAAASVPKEKR